MAADVAPFCALYFPAAQGKQAAEEFAPIVVEKVPAGQLWHEKLPLLLYDPAGQGWQVAADMAPTAAEKVPCASIWQNKCEVKVQG